LIVSLLWRDQVRIGLGPDRLIFAGYRRGVHPRLVRKDIIEVHPDGAQPCWQAAIDALPAALAASGPGKPEVTVVLSNGLVHYALLARNSAPRTQAEWLALARQRFASMHGQVAQGWEIRLTETVRNGPLIACAVDSTLLDALQAKVAEGRATLSSVQPYLIAAFNRIRPKLSHESCWLLIEEPGCLMLALVRSGQWLSIRCRRVDADWRAAFPEILERESAFLALDEPCTKVILYAPTAFGADACSGYQLRDLTLAGGAAPDDRPLAMALA
jgi:hypothetical protein